MPQARSAHPAEGAELNCDQSAVLVDDPPSTRNAVLDTVRGAMLLMMGMNHIPTRLEWLTNHPFGFVSAAAGFVFLAGLLSGLVYTRRALSEGTAAMTRAALRRARTVYAAHLACLFAALSWVWLYWLFAGEPPAGAPRMLYEDPLSAWVAGIALIYQPGLLDILPLYCGFLLMLPLALWQLQRGRVGLVLGLSLLWWALTNLFDAQVPFVRGVINTGAFNFGAWQLLFIAGVVFGHAWAHGRTLLPELPRPAFAGICVVALALALARHILPITGNLPPWLDWLTNKNNLAPIRLLDIALVFYLISTATRAWPRAFAARPLAFLGQQSLPVFSAHVVTVLVILAFPGFFEVTESGRVLGPVLLASVMFATAWLAKHRR